MLPKTLALVDDDREYTEFLSQHLVGLGVHVDVFADSNHLLAHLDPYGYDFYVVDLMLPGIDGVDLIKVLRLRTEAGLLVVSGRLAPDVFQHVINAGADMYLTKPVQFEQVTLALQAVHRRVGSSNQPGAPWRLDRRARQLLAPDGARVDLSDSDLAVMECFMVAGGQAVTREALRERLGWAAESDGSDSLNATIYRLRRRIERATPILVPLQSKSRVGYVFKAPLKAA
ncbi:response regulator transcription factor [Aquabacterium sp.]|uniref:response regulator transcription factor n=1 Tax=Aquabacterium sp. TaxID=1872578 RepID=UPI00248785DD|nr:response regulator transcription factor [Aquabacterium sp.]MDI1258956.1 response regulator transcription factor [Aquabacterium sp.]